MARRHTLLASVEKNKSDFQKGGRLAYLGPLIDSPLLQKICNGSVHPNTHETTGLDSIPSPRRKSPLRTSVGKSKAAASKKIDKEDQMQSKLNKAMFTRRRPSLVQMDPAEEEESVVLISPLVETIILSPTVVEEDNRDEANRATKKETPAWKTEDNKENELRTIPPQVSKKRSSLERFAFARKTEFEESLSSPPLEDENDSFEMENRNDFSEYLCPRKKSKGLGLAMNNLLESFDFKRSGE